MPSWPRTKEDWLVREILLFMGRTLRRYDATAKSFFALIEQESAFGGCLFELALASDRIYMLDDEEEDKTYLAIGALNGGALPMGNGLSRLDQRFCASLRKPKSSWPKRRSSAAPTLSTRAW